MLCVIVLPWHFWPDSHLFLFWCNKIINSGRLWEFGGGGMRPQEFWQILDRRHHSQYKIWCHGFHIWKHVLYDNRCRKTCTQKSDFVLERLGEEHDGERNPQKEGQILQYTNLTTPISTSWSTTPQRHRVWKGHGFEYVLLNVCSHIQKDFYTLAVVVHLNLTFIILSLSLSCKYNSESAEIRQELCT